MRDQQTVEDRATPEGDPRGSRARRLLRLSAFLFVVLGVSVWWEIRVVSAKVTERSLEMGRELSKMKDVLAGSSTLRLNGQRVSLTSVTLEESVASVLDRFTAQCARDSGGVTEELRAAAEAGERLPPFVEKEGLGILRAQKSEDEGTAACFARPGEGGLRDLVSRLVTMAETGDLGALGQLRYVFVRRRPGAPQTHVVSVSSLGKLSLAEMIPNDGDAPGRDLIEGARPAHGRRVLSAELEGRGYAAIVYETMEAPDVALAGFEAPMRAHGFEQGELAVGGTPIPYPTRLYVKHDDSILLLSSQEKGKSVVTAFRLGNGGFVTLRP